MSLDDEFPDEAYALPDAYELDPNNQLHIPQSGERISDSGAKVMKRVLEMTFAVRGPAQDLDQLIGILGEVAPRFNLPVPTIWKGGFIGPGRHEKRLPSEGRLVKVPYVDAKKNYFIFIATWGVAIFSHGSDGSWSKITT